jgi:transposase
VIGTIYVGMGPTLQTRRKAEALQARREEAARLFEAGVPQAEIAQRLKVTPSAVCLWHRVWRRRGVEGLRVKGRWGPEPELTASQGERLAAALLKGAAAHGYDTDLWTLPRIADLIEKLFGVRRHPGHVWRILRHLGWSVQRPTTQAKERDAEAVARWVRATWPRLKKSAARGEP